MQTLQVRSDYSQIVFSEGFGLRGFSRMGSVRATTIRKMRRQLRLTHKANHRAGRPIQDLPVPVADRS
jgi:hypothetical protein